MGHRSRQQQSSKFLAGVPQPYSPEFKAAMVVVMGNSEACLSERVYTFARYFSWGNASDHAVSDWDPDKARPLDQTDCRLFVGCLEDGMPIQEVTAEKLSAMRQNPDLRPKCMKSKQEISRAFRKNEARGTIRCEGRRIIAVPAPEPVERPKSSHLMTFRTDQAFLATRDPAELERLARAKETVAEIERQQKADYREYRKSSNVMTFDPPDPEPEVARSGDSSDRNVMTSGATDLITEEERLKKYIVVVGTTAQPTTTNGCVNGHASAPAATEQNSAVLSAPDPVAEALHYWAPGSDAVAKESLCRMVREIAKDATDDEIAHSINVKGPVARSKKNPTGFLLTAVPNHFRSPALWRADLRRACGAAAEACPAPMTPAQIADVLNDPDFTESQKRQILGDDYRKPS